MEQETTFKYGLDHLTAGKALAIARGTLKAGLTRESREKVSASQAIVKKIASQDEAVYGINTGFGPLCTTKISRDETLQLQTNILMSHSVLSPS